MTRVQEKLLEAQPSPAKKPASALGRPRSFDAEEVLEAATAAFVELGYVGCSLADLERATGVSRMSLYNAIGDKEEIFIQVLRRYTAKMTAFMAELLDNQTLDDIIALLASLQGEEGLVCCKEGCLVVTASFERDQMSDRIREELLRSRDAKTALFANVLQAERDRGRLAPDIAPDEGAAFIVSNFWGAASTARLYDDMAPLQAPIQMLIRTVESWKAEDLGEASTHRP